MSKKPSLQDLITASTQDLVQQSTKLRETISTSKTSIKKKYYEKKLKKANKEIMEHLGWLEIFNRQQQAQQTKQSQPEPSIESKE